jgi:hypothetical protein
MSIRLLPLALAAGILLVANPLTAAADASSYRQAVSDAYSIVSQAAPGDVPAAQRAHAVLVEGTADSQPEILADLEARPPNLQDAMTRLRALLDTLDNPATAADPAGAQSKLHDVMSMHRYDPLHQPPSFFDRVGQWISDRVQQILRALFGSVGPGGVIPAWVVYAIGAAIILAVGIVVFRATAGRVGGGYAIDQPSGPKAPADYFAEADGLAAQGDRVGAIRALCAGVAATLAGERTWEGSPLTVREIFQRAADPNMLRPLLMPFEAAIYGGRDVDEVTYERAARVASQFRTPVEQAA